MRVLSAECERMCMESGVRVIVSSKLMCAFDGEMKVTSRDRN